MNRMVGFHLDKEDVQKAYQDNADFIEIQVYNDLHPITVYLKLTDCYIVEAKMQKQTRGALPNDRY